VSCRNNEPIADESDSAVWTELLGTPPNCTWRAEEVAVVSDFLPPAPVESPSRSYLFIDYGDRRDLVPLPYK
jgi:hypothetical protein